MDTLSPIKLLDLIFSVLAISQGKILAKHQASADLARELRESLEGIYRETAEVLEAEERREVLARLHPEFADLFAAIGR